MNTKTEFPTATTPSPRARWASAALLPLTLLLSCAAVSVSAVEPMAQVRTLMTKPLPNIPGKEATMLLVTYPPGSKDPRPSA